MTTDEVTPAEDNDKLILPDFSIIDSDSRLLELYGEVNEERTQKAIAELYYWRDLKGSASTPEHTHNPDMPPLTNSHLPIDFIISTEGGSVPEMFAIYDCIRDVRKSCEIHTFGVGKVMSAGVLLIAAGTKGKRKIGRNCRLMLHALSGGQFGSLKELEVDIKEVKWYQTQYTKALFEETNLTEKKIRSIFRRKTDTYFDADQAVEWGIADEVV